MAADRGSLTVISRAKKKTMAQFPGISVNTLRDDRQTGQVFGYPEVTHQSLKTAGDLGHCGVTSKPETVGGPGGT